MTKQEFLDALRQRLGAVLPPDEVRKAMEYYEESINDRMEDGMSEAEAVASMGRVEEIVWEQAQPNSPPANQAAPPKRGISTAVKVLLIAVPVCFFAVLVLGAIFFVRLDGDGVTVTGQSEEFLSKQTQTVSEPIQAITVNTTWFNVRIVADEAKAGTVEYVQPDQVTLTVEVADGTLTIQERTPFNVTLRDDDQYTITAYVSSQQALSAFSATSTSGDLYLNGVTVDGSANIECSSGDLVLNQVNFNGNLVVTNTSGDIDATDVTCGGYVNLTTSSGDLELIRLSAVSISGKTTSGDIEFDHLVADTIALSSTSGDIDGTVAASVQDYATDISSTSGEVEAQSVPNGGPKQLTAHTVSGDIKLGFTEQ